MHFLLGIFIINFILALLAAIATPRKYFNKLWGFLFLILIGANITFGIWYYRRKEELGDLKRQHIGFYFFIFMAFINLAYSVTLAYVIPFEDNIIDRYIQEMFYYLLVPTSVLPFLISFFFYNRNQEYQRKLNKEIMDSDVERRIYVKPHEFKRAAPPEDINNLSYDIDDEYISLDDDNDDEINIDL